MGPDLYIEYQNAFLGVQKVKSLQLLSMTKPAEASGYYYCQHTFPLKLKSQPFSEPLTDLEVETRHTEPVVEVKDLSSEPMVEVPKPIIEVPKPMVVVKETSTEPMIEDEPEFEANQLSPKPMVEENQSLPEPMVKIDQPLPEPVVEVKQISPESMGELGLSLPEPMVEVNQSSPETVIEVKELSPEPMIEVNQSSPEQMVEVKGTSSEQAIEYQSDFEVWRSSAKPLATSPKRVTEQEALIDLKEVTSEPKSEPIDENIPKIDDSDLSKPKNTLLYVLSGATALVACAIMLKKWRK